MHASPEPVCWANTPAVREAGATRRRWANNNLPALKGTSPLRKGAVEFSLRENRDGPQVSFRAVLRSGQMGNFPDSACRLRNAGAILRWVPSGDGAFRNAANLPGLPRFWCPDATIALASRLRLLCQSLAGNIVAE